MNGCTPSTALGVPGQGAHAYRIGGLAAVDLLATAGAAYLASRFVLGWHGLLAVTLVFVVLMAAGVAAHEYFCVNTRLNAAIFGRPWPN